MELSWNATRQFPDRCGRSAAADRRIADLAELFACRQEARRLRRFSVSV